MSSQSENDDQMKAGHAPATKVGGMRVVQHKKEGEKEIAALTPEEREEFNVETQSSKDKAGLVVSGAVTKEAKDFPASAVKSYHEKPMPVHDSRPRAPQQTQHIHQPR